MATAPPTQTLESMMEDVVAEGAYKYLTEFVSRVFDDPSSAQTQDTVLAGVAKAVQMMEQKYRRPLIPTFVTHLTDLTAESPKQ